MIDLPHCRPISKNDECRRLSRSDDRLDDGDASCRRDAGCAARSTAASPRGARGRRCTAARGRQLVDRRRQVREEAASQRERFVLGLGLVVDGAVRDVDVAAAELVLVVVRARHREVDERRPGDHHLRGVLDDHRVVARRHARGADAGDRAERERHRRGHRRGGRGRRPSPRICEIGVRPICSIVFTEPPPPMPSTRRMCGSRSSSARPSAWLRLAPIDASDGPAADGEVVARDDDRPAVDLGRAEHEVGRRERDQLAVLVVLRRRRRPCRSRRTSPASTRRSTRSRTVSLPNSC